MYDMTIQLKNNSDKCLYEQIYEHIRQEIREGKLLTGERLPSTRSLAEYLQVSRSTVDLAYAQLLSEGYIESRPYRGYFVCKMEELFQLNPSETVHFTGKATDVNGTKTGKSDDCLYDFSPNGIDMSVFPFSVWKKITNHVLSEDNRGLFVMGEPQGDYELRQTISRYLHSSRGVNCSPEQIVVGAGNDYLLLLLEKLLGHGAGIAMENPTYKRAYRVFRSCACRIAAVDMDGSGMVISSLEKKNVIAAYVMPSHQYPTGTVMPIGRRTELLRWADRAENRYIIEDDYDSEFRYWGKPIPSLQSTDHHGKVIYIGTFSKAIAPAIRVSYMVLPGKLLEKYEQECSCYASTVSRIDQRILNEFIRDGYFERHLNKMRKIYRAKHEQMLQGLECFQKNFRLSGENAGLHLLLTAKDRRTEMQLIESARSNGVKVYGLSDSYIEPAKAMGEAVFGHGATVMLGYGAMTQNQMQEGLALLKKAWL